MNSDIRLHIEFWSHAKTRRMIRTLGLQGPVSLQILWCYAAKHRVNGVLVKMDAHDIEEAAGWPADRAGEFFQYCTRNRWLDKASRGVWEIHEWKKYNPWAAEADARAEDGRRGAHERYHVKRGIVKADCEFCNPAIAPLKAGYGDTNAPAPTPAPAPFPSPAPVAEREREATDARVRGIEARAAEVARWLKDYPGAVQCNGCSPHAPHTPLHCGEEVRGGAVCDCDAWAGTCLSPSVAADFETRFQETWEAWCERRDSIARSAA